MWRGSCPRAEGDSPTQRPSPGERESHWLLNRSPSDWGMTEFAFLILPGPLQMPCEIKVSLPVVRVSLLEVEKWCGSSPSLTGKCKFCVIEYDGKYVASVYSPAPHLDLFWSQFHGL